MCAILKKVVKTGTVITGCFEQTMILCMPRARQQSFYSTGFSGFRFQYNELWYNPALQLLGSFAISERKRFTRHVAGIKRSSGRKQYYPPQFKHPPRIAAALVLEGQLSLKEQHSLREQALRAG